MTIHSDPDCTCYGCTLKNKGVAVSPRVLSTRTQNWRPTPSTPPGHFKNIVTDERPDGSKMPILKSDGSVIRHKEGQEKAAHIERDLARVRTRIAQEAPT